jgi:hypothetical protein
LLAGTKKGLFGFQSIDRQHWTLHGPFQHGHEINHAIYDPRSATIYATANNPWFGCHLVWSQDWGKTWTSSAAGPAFAPESVLQLERLWHIEPGPASSPALLYLGVTPAALFRSDDGGKSWHEMVGLAQHPTRPKWQPGAGGLCLHSILVDPTNPQRLFVGISAAGVFRSDDGGETWVPCNTGVRAEFLPVKYPEVGQCVHKVLMAPERVGERSLPVCRQTLAFRWHSIPGSRRRFTCFRCRKPTSGARLRVNSASIGATTLGDPGRLCPGGCRKGTPSSAPIARG